MPRKQPIKINGGLCGPSELCVVLVMDDRPYSYAVISASRCFEKLKIEVGIGSRRHFTILLTMQLLCVFLIPGFKLRIDIDSHR